MKLRSILLRGFPLLWLALLLVAVPADADARTKGKKKQKESSGPVLQRVPTNPYESIKSRVSNVEFYATNYGIFGHNVAASTPGGYWPRGSNNAYIYGGGIWFGAQKRVDGVLKSLSVIGYDPNSGASWMTPGRVDDLEDNASKYRLYFSTDYNPFTGEPVDPADDRAGGPNWPIWDDIPGDTLKYNRYFGHYVDDTTMRNRETFPKGPAIISGEDVVSVYSDRDLSKYAGEDEPGHPFNIQVEQTVYSWGFGPNQIPSTPVAEITRPYKDMIFLKYLIINKSTDTFYNCYMAPAMDMDIGDAANDRTKIAIEEKADDSLNLAIQWSEAEGGRTFGYIGFDFLESPAVDAESFIRRDKRVYTEDEQIGLTTFQNWVIADDPKTPTERYDFMAAGDRDLDDAAGDKRFLMSTGPFNMAPGDTARVVVGIMFAYGKGGVPNGTWDDMEKILAVDRFAQQVYDQNFLAPTPPEAVNLDWRPLDGGVELSWDETSERSLDPVENGLDFAGYIIQRMRRPGGKFTPTDTLEGWNIGWKTIATIRLPELPSNDARYLAATSGNLGALGAWWRLPFLADTCDDKGLLGQRFVPNQDTVKRPGLPDTIVVGRYGRNVRDYCFRFNPYDDASNQTLIDIYDDTPKGQALLAKYRAIFGQERFDAMFFKPVRDIVRDAIVAIMDSITEGHRFVDVGDDNGDNVIIESPENLSQNEKLINNVDYYYRLISFDAGLPEEGTQAKQNASIFGINEVKATPEAPAPTRGLEPQIVSETGLMGVSNFQFLVLDQDRLGQLFGGDTLEFEFRPLDLYPLPAQFFTAQARYYMTEVTMRRRSTGQELQRFIVPYIFGNRFALTDRTRLNYFPDSVFVGKPDLAVPFTGTFMADPNQLWFGTSAIYKATFGVAFDFTYLQFGDSLRFAAEPFAKQTGGNTNLVAREQYLGVIPETGGATQYQPIPSVGQIKPEVEFLPGGTETLRFEKQGKTYVFPDVPYLNVRVKNVAAFTRDVFDPVTGVKSTVTTNADYEFPIDPNAAIYRDTVKTAETLIRLIDPGYFGLFAYGWLNPDQMTEDQRRSQIQRARFLAQSPVRPIGTPGRYYVGVANGTVEGTSETATLVFTHRLAINGADVLFDFAGMGSVDATFKPENLPANRPTQDFAAGDKVTVSFAGGVLGLPQPGAEVLVAIPDPKPEIANAETGARNYSDEMLEQIQVVPNPYFVSHIGQRANSEGVIYFTRLPEICTIEIYTEAGEQLQVIEHSASPDGRLAVNAWDLMTRANRKSASQLLIARITTPSGAEVIKKFAIVVGGFRVVTD